MNSGWMWGAAAAVLCLLSYLIFPDLRILLADAVDVLASNDIGRARAWVAQFGVWGPAVIVLFMLLQTLIPVLPSVGVMVVATLAYGPVWGGALAWFGLMLAASLGYMLGRLLGATAILRLVGEKNMRTVQDMMERYGVWAVVAARISPLISTDAVSIASGLGRMPFGRFILATGLGTLPLTVIIAVLAEDFERMATGLTVVSIVTLLLITAYVWRDRRRGVGGG